MGFHPPAELCSAPIGIDRKLNSFFQHGRAQSSALRFRPGLVKPVVGDGEGMGHLGRVQEVARVPVGKLRGCLQFLPGALDIPPVAVQPVKQGQRVSALQHTPAGAQEPQPIRNLVARGRLGEDALSLLLQFGVPLLKLSLGRHLLFEAGKVRGREKETRMALAQAGEDFILRRNGDGCFLGRGRGGDDSGCPSCYQRGNHE